MAEEREAKSEEVLGAASEPIAAVSRSLDDISIEEMMAPMPRAVRPDYMVTRYPVEMDEFRSMKDTAEQAAAEPLEPSDAEARADETTADADVEAEEWGTPEDVEAAGPEAVAPTVRASFEGIGQTAWTPPDPTLAVGPGDVLVAVNTDMAGYSKTGALNFRWPNMTTLFSPVLPSGATLFDPVLAYDHYEHRWVAVVGARRQSPRGSWFMVGVSQGTNPAGSWWIWALNASLNGSANTNNWADYPMLAFDTQCIYVSSNMFEFGGSFQYAKLRILYKQELYSGGSVRWYDWWNLKNPDGSTAFTIQPACQYTGTGGNPPAYLINALWPGGNSLTMWTLSNPAAHWRGGSSTWSKDRVSCRSYDFPPDARQLGSGVRIETNDARLLNAVYQYAGGVRRLWTTQTSKHTWSGDSEARSVVQWYEIDVVTKAVVQQNRYGASGKYYFFPAIQTDIDRNAYVVFGRSSSSEYGEARYTGRRATAPANDLESSSRIKAGESAYTGQRWGDYFGICRDGGNNRRVWMYAQYAETGNAWGTWVASAGYS